MKAHLLKIPLKPGHSFNVAHEKLPHFLNQWHHHPELELVHIIQGTGRQFIGDHIHHFKPGDMVLLGPNLPHLWRSEEKYFDKRHKLECEAVVMHFTTECLGINFFNLPENKPLLKLIDKSQQAIRIKDHTRLHIAERMQKIIHAKHSERIIILLDILHSIAHSKETKTVCSKGLQFHYNPSETERLNTIYQYILNNYTGEITLEKIAKVAHMSPHSFCRYFKSRIKKTFSHFLMEVRIGHAAKLLAESNKPVADVCYESGFNNFSNFNRHFKSIIGNTPLAHRKYYQGL